MHEKRRERDKQIGNNIPGICKLKYCQGVIFSCFKI